MERGEADHQAGQQTLYSEFFRDATHARAQARVSAVAALRQAMQPFTRTTRKTRPGKDGERVEEETVQPDWRAALAFLERTYPQHWGRKERFEHEHKGRLRSEVVEVPDDLATPSNQPGDRL